MFNHGLLRLEAFLTEKVLKPRRQLPQRQAKEFIKESLPLCTEDLLRKDRKIVNAIIGLLTGHWKINKHHGPNRRSYMQILSDTGQCDGEILQGLIDIIKKTKLRLRVKHNWSNKGRSATGNTVLLYMLSIHLYYLRYFGLS